jgi:hypothetical protein
MAGAATKTRGPCPISTRVMRSFFPMITASLLLALLFTETGGQNEPTHVAPQKRPLPTGVVRVPTSASDMVDVIYFASYECRVECDQDCDVRELMDAPSAMWQICKPLYLVKEDKAYTYGPYFDPDKWFMTDPMMAPKFRRYVFRMSASGTPVPQMGATLKVEQVGIRFISSEAGFEERFAGGCDIPPAPNDAILLEAK